MATVGLDSLYYAKITEDTNGDETYGTPKVLAKAMTAELSIELIEAVSFMLLKVPDVKMAKAMGAFSFFILLKTLSKSSAHCKADAENTKSNIYVSILSKSSSLLKSALRSSIFGDFGCNSNMPLAKSTPQKCS